MADPKQSPDQQPVPSVRTALDLLAASSTGVEGVERRSLYWGDRVEITTRNSLYRLWCVGDNRFAVTGGWFDRPGRHRMIVGVNGCTWGGSAIRPDLVAAPGFYLELSNGVRTSRIRSVRHVRADWRTASVH